tara:strand:+ start:1329 stop:1532 length:204 start_codon:yes stop_codon:yes gene_type:complete
MTDVDNPPKIFTNVRYVYNIPYDSEEIIGILGEIDGKKCGIPMDSRNSDYADLIKQVEAGYVIIESS